MYFLVQNVSSAYVRNLYGRCIWSKGKTANIYESVTKGNLTSSKLQAFVLFSCDFMISRLKSTTFSTLWMWVCLKYSLPTKAPNFSFVRLWELKAYLLILRHNLSETGCFLPQEKVLKVPSQFGPLYSCLAWISEHT